MYGDDWLLSIHILGTQRYVYLNERGRRVWTLYRIEYNHIVCAGERQRKNVLDTGVMYGVKSVLLAYFVDDI